MSLDSGSGPVPSPLWPDKPGFMNLLALVKDDERYVYLYDDDSTGEVLQTLGRHAADKDLSFSWYDAAVLSQKVRNLLNQKNGQ